MWTVYGTAQVKRVPLTQVTLPVQNHDVVDRMVKVKSQSKVIGLDEGPSHV